MKRDAARKADPNKAVRAKLPAKEQKAYDKALGSEQIKVKRPEDGPAEVEGDSGCRGKATEQVTGKPSSPTEMADQMAKFESLMQDLSALDERVERDPRMTKAYAAWSDCMADAQHTGFSKPSEAAERVQEKVDRIEQSGKLTASTLKPIQTEEIALATADFTCRQQHLTAVEHEVRWKVEADFVKDNKGQLERYRDWRAERQTIR